MKTPTTLYRYDLTHLSECTVEKYRLKTGDVVTVLERDGRKLYRLRNDRIDFYGYATLKEAKSEYLDIVQKEIYQLTEILKKKS